MPPENLPEHQGRTVVRELEILAPRDKVWKAWALPKRLSQWFADRAEGTVETGGSVKWFFDSFGMEIPYEVLVAVPGERLVLKTAMPGGLPGLLDVQLSPANQGTRVKLANSGFLEGADWDDQFHGVESGWTIALEILRYYVECHFARPKSGFLVMSPASFTYEAVHRLFTEPEGLNRWISSRAEFQDRSFEVSLKDSVTLTGRILADTGREVALLCNELEGILELKAFGLGHGKKAVAVRATSWRKDDALARNLEPVMKGAVERLSALLGGNLAR